MTRADSAPILLLTSAILKIESQEQTLASLGNVENFKEPLYLKCGEKETEAENVLCFQRWIIDSTGSFFWQLTNC